MNSQCYYLCCIVLFNLNFVISLEADLKIDNFASLFITEEALSLIGGNVTLNLPKAERSCSNGTMFYWESLNNSLPILDIIANSSAYSVSSTSGCSFCLITEEGHAYQPIDNDNFLVFFIPYCVGKVFLPFKILLIDFDALLSYL